MRGTSNLWMSEFNLLFMYTCSVSFVIFSQEENYHRITVDIELQSGEIIRCQTYEFDDLYMMEASDD